MYAGADRRAVFWASIGTRDPDASDELYVRALRAQFTIDTMPEATLLDFADHVDMGEVLSTDGVDSEVTLARFAQAGVDVFALALRQQQEGAVSLVESWNEAASGHRSHERHAASAH
jgi:transaldolase